MLPTVKSVTASLGCLAADGFKLPSPPPVPMSGHTGKSKGCGAPLLVLVGSLNLGPTAMQGNPILYQKPLPGAVLKASLCK